MARPCRQGGECPLGIYSLIYNLHLLLSVFVMLSVLLCSNWPCSSIFQTLISFSPSTAWSSACRHWSQKCGKLSSAAMYANTPPQWRLSEVASQSPHFVVTVRQTIPINSSTIAHSSQTNRWSNSKRLQVGWVDFSWMEKEKCMNFKQKYLYCKTTLVLIMAWCHMAPSHYLNHSFD